VQIAIISDTHLPRGTRRLPDACVARLTEADLIVHAGDFMRYCILNELRALGPPLLAVHGNVDDAELRRELPPTAEQPCERIRLAVIHDAGPRQGRLQRMRARFPDADAVVFGAPPLTRWGWPRSLRAASSSSWSPSDTLAAWTCRCSSPARPARSPPRGAAFRPFWSAGAATASCLTAARAPSASW
jgi:putative phosphoesterase